MSNISSKITSIEPEKSESGRSLGLRPAAEDSGATLRPGTGEDPVPAFLSNPKSSAGEMEAPQTSLWSRVFPLLAGLIWIIGAVFLAHIFFNLRNAGENLSVAELAALIFLIVGPACLIVVTVYALQRLAELSRLSAQLGQATEKLFVPDQSVGRKSKDLSISLQKDVDKLNERIDGAIARVGSLGEALEEHNERLTESSYFTEEKTEVIATRLSTEREALWSMANTFDERMKALSKMLADHTENLTSSTQLAEQKIDEARVSVEGAAEKINSASDIVRSNTVNAAETLDSNHSELIRLGDGLKSKAEDLDAIFSKHTEELKSMIADLRSEQESLTNSMDEQLQKMRDTSLSAKVSAERLVEASAAGKQTVEALADAAQLSESAIKKRFSEMEDMVRYSHSKAENISEKAARRVQQSLSHTREEIARIEKDMIALQDRLQRTPNLPADDLDIEALNPSPQIEEETNSTDEQVIPVQNKLRKSISLKPADPNELSEISVDLSDVHITGLVDDDQDEHFEIPVPEKTAPEPVEVSDDKLELRVEAPDVETKPVIEPDEIVQDDENILRRTIPEIRKPQKEESNRPWWKSILGRGDADPETQALDRMVAPSRSEQHEGEVIMALAQMGLAPGAIVDEGCIVEASDIRLSKGANAMSQVVANRLGDPVAHLRKALDTDHELKTQLSQFAARFHNQLESLDKDRDVIRSALQKDDGRAFLICDAALNT